MSDLSKALGDLEQAAIALATVKRGQPKEWVAAVYNLTEAALRYGRLMIKA